MFWIQSVGSGIGVLHIQDANGITSTAPFLASSGTIASCIAQFLSSCPSFLMFILLIWGASWSLPFYVPPGLMAMAVGGIRHAALLSNIMDGAAMLVGAFSSEIALKHGKLGRWSSSLFLMMLGSIIACIFMRKSMLLDLDTPANNISISKSLNKTSKNYIYKKSD